MPPLDLLDRFKGCMVGAVLGDCLGAPLEFVSVFRLPIDEVEEYFESLDDKDCTRIYPYTDDTAMARQVSDVSMSLRYTVSFFKSSLLKLVYKLGNLPEAASLKGQTRLDKNRAKPGS